MTCGRCSGPVTGTTRSRKPGENVRHSARSGESITAASGNAGRIPPTRHTSRTYLNYDHRIHPMIYTTNWIERLQKDFRRVTRMRGAIPNEESVILLIGKTAMDKKSYLKQVPRIDLDRTLFPDK